MFVDASAIVAILMRENAWRSLSLDLDAPAKSARVTNPIAVWEAVAALHRRWGVPVTEAQDRVSEFLEAGVIAMAPVGLADIAPALAAFEAYGRHRYPDPKDRNKGLNIADCFHYATAKAHGGDILTLDTGFALTDLNTEPAPD